MRRIAIRLFSAVECLPIVSPHGHTDPAWFANDAPFEDAVSLLLWPDHYLLRMLMSAGVTLESLGIQPSDAAAVERDRRVIWRRFAEQYHLFRATPSRHWLEHVFGKLFELKLRLEPVGTTKSARSRFSRSGIWFFSIAERRLSVMPGLRKTRCRWINPGAETTRT